MNRWKSRMWNKVYKCAFWLTKRWITMFTSTLRLWSWYQFSWRYKTWVSALKPAWYFFKCLFNKYQLTCRRWIFVFILEPDRLFDFRGPVQITTLGSKKKINKFRYSKYTRRPLRCGWEEEFLFYHVQSCHHRETGSLHLTHPTGGVHFLLPVPPKRLLHRFCPDIDVRSEVRGADCVEYGRCFCVWKLKWFGSMGGSGGRAGVRLGIGRLLVRILAACRRCWTPNCP